MYGKCKASNIAHDVYLQSVKGVTSWNAMFSKNVLNGFPNEASEFFKPFRAFMKAPFTNYLFGVVLKFV